MKYLWWSDSVKIQTAKSFIINVWYGSKYTPEVLQDSKINVKWTNTEMLEKTVHFFNVFISEPESLFNLQHWTSLEKRRRHIQLFSEFCEFFRNTFIMENLLRTGFKRIIFRKMAKQNSYYNKKISWSRQLFQKQTLRGTVYIWEPLIESSQISLF